VDTEIFAPAQTDGNRKNAILLCSGLAVYRNRAAALWFARRMFPMVRREVPDAEFWIVGSHPNREIWRLAKVPGIHVTGTVEDVRPYYAMAKVAVAPYRYGEGTKIKVVEAMACGTPVVSTSIGCQGLDVIDGKHLQIADNETDFSRRVIEALCDPQRAQMLAVSGRTLVEEEYGWRSIIGGLQPRLQDLLFPRCDLRVKNDVTNPGRRGGTGMKKVGVVILNWNGGPLTPRCIESLKQSEYSPWQVVVVDNGSTDGSLEEIAHRFPEVVFIKNATNLGFAEGCNQGMRWLFEQSADFALILNNDTTVHPAMISRLVATANAQDEPVCLSPKMYVSDDPCRLWFACGRVNLWTGVFSNPAYHSVDSARFDRTREMEYASGCCVLIPREIFRAVGGFDERFFAYCEDVEWSIRCRRKGFRLLLSPQAKLWHGVAAVGKKKPALMRYLMTRNHLWTVRRHANAWQFACVLLLSPLRSSWRLGKIALAGQWGCIPAEFRGVKDGLFARLGQSSLGSL
jgi:hypothetical protein